MSETKRVIIGTTGAVVMVGGVTWTASWFFAAGNPSAWRLAPAVVMFLIGLGAVLWALRRPDPRQVVLARLNALIADGVVLLFHTDPEFTLRYNDWIAQVGVLLTYAFTSEVALSITPPLSDPTLNLSSGIRGRFEWQHERLALIRTRFMAGEIKLDIAKDPWIALS